MKNKTAAIMMLLWSATAVAEEPPPTEAEAPATTAEVAPPAPPAPAPAPPPPREVPAVVEEASEPVNSINLSPLGALVGNYAVTYERLVAGHHGLSVEGIATLSNGDDGDSKQFGGAVGYR